MADKTKYYYLKIKENFFDTEDMKLLESMDNGYLYSNILMKMYLLSLKNNGKLMYKDKIPYNSKMLSTILNHNVDILDRAIDIFKELNLIEVLDSGAIFMLDIQNYIGRSSDEADRKRDYRNRIETAKQIEMDKCPDKCRTNLSNIKDRDKDIDIDKKEIYKEKYGEFNNVLLTDEEYHKLEESNLLPYIEKLSSYIASKGKKYKSHYATILTWNRTDKKENTNSKKHAVEPEWLNKEYKEELTDETRKMLEYVNG